MKKKTDTRVRLTLSKNKQPLIMAPDGGYYPLLKTFALGGADPVAETEAFWKQIMAKKKGGKGISFPDSGMREHILFGGWFGTQRLYLDRKANSGKGQLTLPILGYVNETWDSSPSWGWQFVLDGGSSEWRVEFAPHLTKKPWGRPWDLVKGQMTMALMLVHDADTKELSQTPVCVWAESDSGLGFAHLLQVTGGNLILDEPGEKRFESSSLRALVYLRRLPESDDRPLVHEVEVRAKLRANFGDRKWACQSWKALSADGEFFVRSAFSPKIEADKVGDTVSAKARQRTGKEVVSKEEAPANAPAEEKSEAADDGKPADGKVTRLSDHRMEAAEADSSGNKAQA